MCKKLPKCLYGGMLLGMLCFVYTNSEAQHHRRKANNKPIVASDTSQQKNKSAAASAIAALTGNRSDAPKPYKEVITAKAVAYRSFLTVQKIEDKYFLEVPDSILGREILVINRIGMAPADFRSAAPIGYAGDIIGQQVFHFSKGENNRLFIRTKSYRERSADSSANGLARLLARNNMEPIVNSFAVKAVNDSLHTSVIEITDLLGQDNNLFGFSANAKMLTGLANIQPEGSYLDSVKSYGDNIGFTFMRTYMMTAKGLGGAAHPFTFRLHTGMILLPAQPMAVRFADKRTAWQNISYIDFDNNPLGVIQKDIITRWRLEPADPNAYAVGQVTAPLQPIKMFMDPAMPAKWKPYIKAGIEAWNTAFEKAGFRQAIQVIQGQAAEGVSYLDNVQRSAVVFMPGTAKSVGSMIVDPRSGEILRVQMNFYLSTLDTLYKQYFIQAAALDKGAQRPVFDDALMGRLVQVWATQTMGRLLGLKINAGASFGNKVADLRNNGWLTTNAFNGSVTDPVLVNYVVQPEDRIDLTNLLPRISATDEWMINWGYRVVPGDETVQLNKMIREGAPQSMELYIGDLPERVVIDPRNQVGDLSNDAVLAATLGINNLKRIVPHLVEWTSEPAANNDRAGELYDALLNRYAAYARYVLNQIGGLYINIRKSDQPGNVYAFAPTAMQKKAVQFLNQEVFETPTWLADKTLYSRTTQRFDSVMNVQRALLKETMSVDVMSKLQVSVNDNAAAAYSPMAFLNDLSAGLFAELKTNRAILLPRRELQQEYITRLLAVINTLANVDNDLPAVLNLHARNLLALLKEKKTTYTGVGQSHVALLYERLYNGIYKKDSNNQKK